jgi:hypothetical protein
MGPNSSEGRVAAGRPRAAEQVVDVTRIVSDLANRKLEARLASAACALELRGVFDEPWKRWITSS